MPFCIPWWGKESTTKEIWSSQKEEKHTPDDQGEERQKFLLKVSKSGTDKKAAVDTEDENHTVREQDLIPFPVQVFNKKKKILLCNYLKIIYLSSPPIDYILSFRMLPHFAPPFFSWLEEDL